MKKHNGMRPHDIVILLKISAKKDEAWYMKDLAYELGISQGEISESLNRSVTAGLLEGDKKRLMKNSLLEFLEFGFRYVFPQQSGAITRGMATAHSAPPLSDDIASKDKYVWPWAKGNDRGFAIKPLHPSVPEACQRDAYLHQLLALTDSLRVGMSRERKLAIQHLKEMI
ncbi:MAG: hypothetical protein KDC44_10170 [Phaeodactylibacter sp.]|nr:hypothetical protein [Phaeodactylibacter sp.]